MTSDLKAEFACEVDKLCKETIKKVYPPERFLQMVARKGALDATKELLHKHDEVQSGFCKLVRAGQEKLCIENLVVKEKYKDLFSQSEKDVAKFRIENPELFCD